MKSGRFLLCLLFAASSAPALAQEDLAKIYGFRESIGDISLSPDGTKIAFIQPENGRGDLLFVATIGNEESAKGVTRADGKPWHLRWCGWASNNRLVCKLSGIIETPDYGLLAYSRLIALNADGSNVKQLEQRRTSRTLGFSQFDGAIIGWPATDNGEVLMSRTYLEENSTGTHLANTATGLGVDLINTSTGSSKRVESPRDSAVDYISDNDGKVRLMVTEDTENDGTLRGVTRYYYRQPDSRDWKVFSVVSSADGGTVPLAVDGKSNVAYAVKNKDGRAAIYAVTLDGTNKEALLLANDRVDVNRLVRFGRSGRIIGAQYVADKEVTELFDPEYKALAAKLRKALPGLPLISMVDASRDENRILIFAGSDTDPGRYYVYDKTAKSLSEIALARPALEGRTTAEVKMVEYPAADGTMIPAYLTLPPGSDGKGLPAIVMPHGGPSSRDEWGFDWLSQFYAAKGYAVLQPNFRGSAGYGDEWYVDNGFKSWRTAVGDVNDAGRWLISQGIAKPQRLGIVGWSYGGYAALQSSVLDADLFKAIVAIAPVTDLKMLIEQSEDFTNAKLTQQFIGSGEHLVSGSPLQQVTKIKAPVLMFSGDEDLNVDVKESREMAAALTKAGKNAELVVYPGLDHQINDSVSRADMLSKSADFLAKYLPE